MNKVLKIPNISSDWSHLWYISTCFFLYGIRQILFPLLINYYIINNHNHMNKKKKKKKNKKKKKENTWNVNFCKIFIKNENLFIL